jgi:hypothetical protein
MSIYVDLDGTLAKYDKWRGKEHIGEPIQTMLNRIHTWLDEGETVVIFTARAGDKEAIPYIEDYLEKIGLPALEITNIKGHEATEFWDDKGKQVIPNTGTLVE